VKKREVVIAACLAALLVLVVLYIGGCELNLTNTQEQEQEEGGGLSATPTGPVTPAEPDPEEVKQVRIAKFGGNCGSPAGVIYTDCPDSALLTCSAIGQDGTTHLGQAVGGAYIPSWFGAPPVAITVSSINQFNSRGSCTQEGTGSVTCVVDVAKRPDLRKAAEKFYECKPQP
jgi:hypothetical protein